MEKNRDVGKILLKINSQYYEKGMKNISIQLKGVRKGKIAEMDRKVIIPQIIRSKEYNIFEKQFLKNIDDEIKNIAKQDKVQEIVRALRASGGKTNSTCGIHIHLDGADHNVQSIKNFINIIASKNDLLYKALQIKEERMRWCKKMDQRLITEIQKKKPKTMQQIKDISPFFNIIC